MNKRFNTKLGVSVLASMIMVQNALPLITEANAIEINNKRLVIKSSNKELVGKKYNSNVKVVSKSIEHNETQYVPEETKTDLNKTLDIKQIELMTDSKYEIALAYENGDYTYIDSADTIEKAMKIVKNVENSKGLGKNIIPTIVNEDGLIVYATDAIGKVVKFVDGQATTNNSYTVSLYSNASKSGGADTYIAHGYIDDVPIIEDNGTMVKVEVNGYVGWMNKSDSVGLNIIQVPINQAQNLSNFTVNGSILNHYISSNIETSGGHTIKIGVAPSFMKEGVKYYSYDGNYFYDDIRKLIKDANNNVHSNAINSNNPYYNYYSYLPGRSKVSYTAAQINSYIEANTPWNSILRGHGQAFIDAQNKYGVNAAFILGVAMNESGRGTSWIAINKNNIFGLNAIDSNPGQAADTFSSVAACIEDFAKNWMSVGYYNPKDWRYSGSSLGNKAWGVNVRYASDPYWGEKAASYMYEMDRYISGSGQLIEHNKYKLGMYTTTNNVSLDNGQVLYNINSSRYQAGKIGDVVTIVGESDSKYKVYPDRPVPFSVNNTGAFDWNQAAYTNKSGINIISKGKQDDTKQSVVKEKFKQFYIYGSMSNPSIDLSNKNEIIKNYRQAVGILKRTVNGKKYDRQKFLDAWNNLTASEKEHEDMQKIKKEYKKIINVAEAARDTYKFVDNVKENADNLIKDANKAAVLNDKNNKTFGARGKAYYEYRQATKYGEDRSNSERMNYIYKQYRDAVNFLNVSIYLRDFEIDKAKSAVSKIKDSKLKSIANTEVSKYKLTNNQIEAGKKFRKFYIYGAMSNPTIDLSNKDESIKTFNQTLGILKTTVDGKKYDRQKFLDAWKKLSDKEKENAKMQEIQKEYKKIVSVAEAAKDTYKFYYNVKNNANDFINNPKKAIALNSKTNMTYGARGKAYESYSYAAKHGENRKNSKRMNYISIKYNDTVNFLDTIELVSKSKDSDAKIEANKINDNKLKKLALNSINEI